MVAPIIIAEAGVNHNGDPELARRLVDAAADAGADYVKFQTFKTSSLVTRSAAAAGYQKGNCNADSQFEMLSRLELPFEAFAALADYCASRHIGFLSTPFDAESTDFLATLGMDFMKVPSGEITNLPYLRHIASTGIPAIISSGMSGLAEVEDALAVFYGAGYSPSSLTLLHCNTQYPTPMADVNLRAMLSLREAFGVKTGYSDHTLGIEVPVAAAALGAAVIEKHFTLDKSLPGPDHMASLSPSELKEMVRAVRNVTVALGSGVKRVSDSERGNMAAARKSIVAACPIRKGEMLHEGNLAVKRPGTGISPMRWDEVVGTRALRDYLPDELI